MICCVPILNPDDQGCEQGHLTKIQTQKLVEAEIQAAFPDAEVLTHLDPAGAETVRPLDRK